MRNAIKFLLVIIGLYLFASIIAVTLVHATGIYMMDTLVCDDTAAIEKDLNDNYHEQIMGSSIDKKGHLIRLFKADKTWTILSTYPNEMTCVMSAGEDWQTEKSGNPT